ncbi:MAG: substrate-binding domain-containing protein, partial [Kiritimatiellia bacterium]
ERLVLHLHKQGHRNIGFAGLEERPLWSLERYAGFLHAAKELGLQTPPGWMINAIEPAVKDSQLDEPVLEATRQGVTAWACVSDGLAHRLYCIFKNAGLRVPEDVSITGFDGIKRLKDCPALTTMEVPWKEMGEGALAAIIERIHNPSATAVHREYMGKFVRGKSTAPPRED